MNADAGPLRAGRRSPTGRLKRAAPWAAAESLFSAGATLLATLFVARLLEPAEFGMAAIALAVAALVQVIAFAGMPQALIRTRHLYPSLSDQVFWVMLGLGLIGSALCWALAAPLARTYGEPLLFWLIGVQGVECIIAALVQFPTALMTRKMRTRSLALRMLGFKSMFVLVTVGVALAGGGAWSLIAGSLAGGLVSVLLLWRSQARAPRLRAFDGRLKPILSMGGLIMVEQAMITLAVRGFILLFGKYHGLQDLGLLNFAMRLVDEVGTLISLSVRRVSLAFFVSLQRAGRDLGAAFLLGSHGIMLGAAPLFFGLAAVSVDAIPLIFGEHWRPAVPAVQLLSLFWGLKLSRVLAPGLMRTLGAQSSLMMNAAIGLVAAAVAVVATQDAPFAIAAAAYGAQVLVTIPAGIMVLRRASGVKVRQQLRAVGFPLVAAAIMAFSVMATREMLVGIVPPLPRLALLIGCGAMLYAALVVALDERKVRNFLNLVRAR